MTSTVPATPVEDGTFTNGWNTTVVEAFPEFAGSTHQGCHAVTVGQFLRMRGALPRNPADWNGRLVPGQADLNADRGPVGTAHISIEDRAKAEQRAVGP